MRGRLAASVLLALALAACRPEAGGSVAVDEPDRCGASSRVGEQSAALQAADRKIIGVAAPYPADGALRGRDDDLSRSQRLRRAVAWRTVAKVLAPVPLAEALPVATGLPAEVPIWQTWYARDDIHRMFHSLFKGLGREGRRERAPFSGAALDGAFAWNLHAVEGLPSWPEERWRDYLASIDEAAEVAGLGGIARVGYSPASARHLFTSYPQILKCLSEGAPAPFGFSVDKETQQLMREQVRVDACSQRVFGPFSVGEGETLRASSADSGASGAWIAVRGGAALGEDACHVRAGDACEAAGPGAFFVVLGAGAEALDTRLAVVDDKPKPERAACLAGAFPLDSAVVKADWRRAQFGQKLPVYATSAEALSRRLSPQGAVAWGEGDGEADPGPDDIYTLRLGNGNSYRLAGLHLMTKELDHWLWITLWWSPTPDEDFGADRPLDLVGPGDPWRNYKMCVVTSFEERDTDPEGGFGADSPSLGRALAAAGGARRRDGAPSWCSNPYLESGPGNAGTNCIGCHQHGGAALRAEEILGDEERFPGHGRTLVRNNFPMDYSWAVNAGDELGQRFADEAAYSDTSDATDAGHASDAGDAGE